MKLSVIKLLFDFGLMILIWMVQLLVYPSFKYMGKEQLLAWHGRYAGRIASIVIPLMLGQLAFSGVLIFHEITSYQVFDAILVIVVWTVTFCVFVPLHRKISCNEATEELLKKLVSQNWSRTIIWTGIFLLNLYSIFVNRT